MAGKLAVKKPLLWRRRHHLLSRHLRLFAFSGLCYIVSPKPPWDTVGSGAINAENDICKGREGCAEWPSLLLWSTLVYLGGLGGTFLDVDLSACEFDSIKLLRSVRQMMGDFQSRSVRWHRCTLYIVLKNTWKNMKKQSHVQKGIAKGTSKTLQKDAKGNCKRRERERESESQRELERQESL